MFHLYTFSKSILWRLRSWAWNAFYARLSHIHPRWCKRLALMTVWWEEPKLIREYFNAELSNVTISNTEWSFQPIKKGLIEWDIFNTEKPSQNFYSKLIVLNSVDVFTKLFDHYLLNNWFDHLTTKLYDNFILYYICFYNKNKSLAICVAVKSFSIQVYIDVFATVLNYLLLIYWMGNVSLPTSLSGWAKYCDCLESISRFQHQR